MAQYGRGVAGEDEIAWRLWTPEGVGQVLKEGKIAFVDFTAAYCTVCKANKLVAIDTPEFREALRKCGAVPFQGDFSTGDDAIADVLQQFDRPGVPLNLVYLPGRPDRPIVLKPSFDKQYLLEKLSEAGCSATAAAAMFPSASTP
jgi:suppressor for copper-sensitivity B